MFKIMTIMLLLFSTCLLAQTSLFEMKSDKESYLPQEKAILVTHVQTNPESQNFEVVIKSYMDSIELEVVKVSNNNYISKIENVGNGPLVTFKTQYFLRDKFLADDYEKAIKISQERIIQFLEDRRVASSTDRPAISIQIDKEEERIIFYKNKIASLARLVDEKLLVVSIVNPVENFKSGFIFLNADREDPVYIVGEKANLFAHVYFRMKDKDVVVKAKWNENNLSVIEMVNNEFLIETPLFSNADIGTQIISAELWVRDLYRNRQLDEALSFVQSRILELDELIENETDPARVVDYQIEKSRLLKVKAHIEALQSENEQKIETVKFRLDIEGVK